MRSYQAQISLYNATNCVWWPGSPRTRWGSSQHSPDPLAVLGEKRRGEGKQARRKGRTGMGRGEEGKGWGEGKGSHPIYKNPGSATAEHRTIIQQYGN